MRCARLADELGAPDVAPPPEPQARPTCRERRDHAGEPSRRRSPRCCRRTRSCRRERHASAATSSTDSHAAAPHDWLQITGGAIGVGPAAGHRRRHRRTGPPRGRAAGRRLGDVHAAGAVDAGARAAADHHGHPLEPQVSDPARRTRPTSAPIPAASRSTCSDLGNPDIDWVQLAQGMGVEAARATTANEFADLFVQANKASGPFLIELII